jgi:hypothetical protein
MSLYFTVGEANHLLPRVRPLATTVMRLHGEIITQSSEIESVLEKSRFDSGSRAASEMVLLFQRYEAAMKQLNRIGVQVKDPATGLCDFPARYDGREILLCWRVGEAQVEWWHDHASGFRGRRHISELPL